MAATTLSRSGAGVALLRQAANMLACARLIHAGGDDRSRAQRDALAAFAVRVASAAILYLSQIVLARWMGTFEYGIYVFVWTWVLVLGGLSHLGLSTAMMRLLPEYKERGEHDLLRGLLMGSRIVAIGVGTLIAAAGLLAVWLLGERLSSHYVLPAYIVVFCVPLFALTELQDGMARARGWMGAGLTPPYVLRPLLLLMCMTAAHVLGWPMQATVAAGAAVIATWLAALVQTVLIARRFGSEGRTGTRRFAFAGWFKASLPLLAISACDIALQNTDVLILSAFMSPNEVGMYFAASKTMSLIMFIHYAVGSAVANRFSALNARGDRDSLRAFVKDAVNWTFWPSLAAAVVILALGKPLLWLFSPQFTEAYPVMFVLAVGFLLRASMGPAEFVLNMLGEQTLCAGVLVVSAVLNVALGVALVPAFGMLGAASATALALAAAAGMNLIVARRRLELEISIWNSVRGR
jgi:O-antigen/teichoic acid export membrane protein